ncbi:hypothetical protein [Bacillus horti]|uniref:Uncharacterized protein n=1 Tax=Caldalkalibacillus horti TaxID=77523 RepID=A0ABT9VY20_9BACI|nr:hypothetical protein [Bacillus horti]MDQ0165869.1 hypothetical protein [Bacillus horti]
MVLTHTFYKTDYIPNFLAGWHVHLDVLADVLEEKHEGFPWDKVKAMKKEYMNKLGQ